MNITYLAIIEQAEEGGFGVYFPDLPGCTSGGDTLAAAKDHAAEALRAFVEISLEHGDRLPPPAYGLESAPEPDVKEAARMMISARLPTLTQPGI